MCSGTTSLSVDLTCVCCHGNISAHRLLPVIIMLQKFLSLQSPSRVPVTEGAPCACTRQGFTQVPVLCAASGDRIHGCLDRHQYGPHQGRHHHAGHRNYIPRSLLHHLQGLLVGLRHRSRQVYLSQGCTRVK